MTRGSSLRSLYPDECTMSTLGDSEVPARFGAPEVEYDELRNRFGLVDYAAAGLLQVLGAGGRPFLQSVLARDIEYLTEERCLPCLILDASGTPLDIVSVYALDDGSTLLETAFGQSTATFEYLSGLAPPGVEVRDVSSTYGLIGLEGPYSWGVIGREIDKELVSMPFESVMETTWDGSRILFSRTGCTGEYGYRVMGEHDVLRRLWKLLSEEATPVGYEVLLCAMLEVRQPIFHLEAGGGRGVVESGLGWLMDVTKSEYVGRDAALSDYGAPPSRGTVGFVSEAVGLAPGTPVLAGDVKVGAVVHSDYSYGLKSTLGLTELEAPFNVSGLSLAACPAGADPVPIRTTSSPFIVPQSWTVPIL